MGEWIGRLKAWFEGLERYFAICVLKRALDRFGQVRAAQAAASTSVPGGISKPLLQ